MGSDNLVGAENQQERLIRIGWVVGFVDGEGCFSIGFVKQPERAHRRGYRTGYQVTHSFVVVQGARSVASLHGLRDFFGVGAVSINRRHDNHKEHLHRFIVGARNELLDVVIPFFRAFPLRTAKHRDFEAFARCVEICASGRHLTVPGLIEIAEIAQTMNHRKSRSDLIRILRGHTPNTLRDAG
jgi:LAGLIDADG endonuclease